MTIDSRLRRGAVILTLAAALAAPTRAVAQRTPDSITRYSATAVGLDPGAGETLRIELLSWSTDDERKMLLEKASTGADADLQEALRSAPSHGYIFTGSESVGYSVRYAVRMPLPGGGERVVVATERPLGTWGAREWRVADNPGTSGKPFTVIELRLGATGSGEGKMSIAASVGPDPDTNVVALQNWDSAPVLLKPVARVSGGA